MNRCRTCGDRYPDADVQSNMPWSDDRDDLLDDLYDELAQWTRM